MNETQAKATVKTLISVKNSLIRARQKVGRARKYRPSEQAMTMASYSSDIGYMQDAIDFITEKTGIKKEKEDGK